MSQSEHTNHVRRVVLPSGRAIEVVYFENQPAQGPSLTRTADTGQPQLHLCSECACDLVYPVQWEEASSTHWEVQLRCPNCEWEAIDLYPQDAVDRFDEQLDLGTDILVRDLQALTRANMQQEVERFSTALASDAIWPMDF